MQEEIARLGHHADLNHLDVSSVINMGRTFQGLTFHGDISQWDVASAEDMGAMFAQCPFSGDLSKWDVQHVRTMKCMFQGSLFNGDISRWNTARVLNMANMFHQSRFNGDLSQWDVQNVQDFQAMFMASAFCGDTSQWKFSNVRCINDMFCYCPWRGIPGNLRFRAGLEFTLFFDPKIAHEFLVPNFYHWFLALTGHTAMHQDWRMLAALVPKCKDVFSAAQATVVLQEWWENCTSVRAESYDHAFESNFLT